MRRLKKSLAVVLSLLILISCIPMQAFAAASITITPTGTANNIRVDIGGNTAGNLEGELDPKLTTATPPYTTANIVELKVAGVLNQADLDYIRNYTAASGMTNLVKLDLSGATLDASLNNEIGISQFRSLTKLESVLLPAGVEKLGNSVFQSCGKLESLNLSDLTALKSLGNNVFSGTAFKSFDFSAHADLDTIGTSVFASNSKLESVILAGTALTTIPTSTFKDATALKGVDLSGLAIGAIGNAAFQNCASMEKLDLSKLTVTNLTIGTNAFAGCTVLKSIDLTGSTVAMFVSATAAGNAGAAPAFDGLSVVSIIIPASAYDDYVEVTNTKSWNTLESTNAVRFSYISAPVNVTATATGNQEITLTWQAPAFLDPGYTIDRYEYSQDGGVNWTQFYLAPIGAVYSLPVKGLTNYNDYNFLVRGYDSAKAMSGATAASAKVMAVPYDAEEPAISTNLVNSVSIVKDTLTGNTLTVTVDNPENILTVPPQGSISFKWYKNTTGTPSPAVDTPVTGDVVTPAAVATDSTLTCDTAVVGKTYYYAVVTNNNPSALNSKDTVVISDICEFIVRDPAASAPPVLNSEPQNATYVLGTGAAPLSVSATSPDGGTLFYRWYSNTIKTIPGATALTSGTSETTYTPDTSAYGILYYFVNVENTSPLASAPTELSSRIAEITVTNEAPNITVAPAGKTYTLGDVPSNLTATASVSDGGTLSFEWFSNTANSLVGATSIKTENTSSSSHTSTLVLADPSVGLDPDIAATTYFFVVITSDNTDTALTSSTEETVSSIAGIVYKGADAETPAITDQPVGGTYKIGDTAAMKVEAAVTDSGTLSYQWYESTTNTNPASFTAITGATQKTYIPNTSAAVTAYYYVVVTNTNSSATGNKSVTVDSNIATVIVEDVIPATPTFTNPVSTTYVQGSVAVPLTVNASITDSGTLSYVWYSNTTGIVNPAVDTPILNATNPIYVPLTATLGTTYYYVAITNTLSGKTTTVESATAKIDVVSTVLVDAETPVISKDLSSADDKLYEVGDTATEMSVTVNSVSDGGTLNYQWYKSITATANPSTDVAIPSETDKSYTPTTTVSGIDYYYVVATNKNTGVTGNPEVSVVSATVKIEVVNKGASFTVSFIDDTTTLSTANVIPNEKATKPTDPEKEGYKFTGWFTDVALTTAYDFDTAVTADLSLYAKWVETETHKAFVGGFPDKTFRPNASIIRAEAAQMFYNLLENPESIDISKVKFDDVNSTGQWYYKPVLTLNALGVISGDGDGRFRPNDKITRAEFTSMVKNYFKLADSTSPLKFPDVTTKHWAWKSIAAVSDAGIVVGDESGKFNPEMAITRAEAVVMLNKGQGRFTTDKELYKGMEMPFTDVPTSESNNHWAWENILEASVEHDHAKST